MDRHGRKKRVKCNPLHIAFTAPLLSLSRRTVEGGCNVSKFIPGCCRGTGDRRLGSVSACFGRHGSGLVHQQSRQPAAGGDQKRLDGAEIGGLSGIVPDGFRRARPRPLCARPFLAGLHPVRAAGIPVALRALRRAHLQRETVGLYRRRRLPAGDRQPAGAGRGRRFEPDLGR